MNLEQLFQSAFEDENVQSTFYYELLNQCIYVLGEAVGFDGVLEEGDELKLVRLKHEGQSYVPVFLSKPSLDLFLDGNETPYFCAKGHDIFETLKQGNVVINPGQEASIVLYANEIAHILSQGRN